MHFFFVPSVKSLRVTHNCNLTLLSIEDLQINIHSTQTDWFQAPLSHCSNNSDSHLCFHSVLLGLLQYTCWLCSTSLTDCKHKAPAELICNATKKTKTKMTYSSVTTLVTNQCMKTVNKKKIKKSMFCFNSTTSTRVQYLPELLHLYMHSL